MYQFTFSWYLFIFFQASLMTCPQRVKGTYVIQQNAILLKHRYFFSSYIQGRNQGEWHIGLGSMVKDGWESTNSTDSMRVCLHQLHLEVPPSYMLSEYAQTHKTIILCNKWQLVKLYGLLKFHQIQWFVCYCRSKNPGMTYTI